MYPYTTNEVNGKCLKPNEEKGYNAFDYQHTAAIKGAECTDLSQLNLVYFHGSAMIPNLHELGFKILQGYNFKSCKLDTCTLFFNPNIVPHLNELT